MRNTIRLDDPADTPVDIKVSSHSKIDIMIQQFFPTEGQLRQQLSK